MGDIEQSATETSRLRAVVKGRVQGVGFRYFVQRHAVRLGLSGWVRNRVDGTVELEAEGNRQALAELLRLVQAGPPMAHVTDVQAVWMPARGDLPHPFQVVPTGW
ncbi:MAG: acylphosphatase [Armatimonadetes bacterium]|nr:acylphosphatase [Armatimonadota bacterium]